MNNQRILIIALVLAVLIAVYFMCPQMRFPMINDSMEGFDGPYVGVDTSVPVLDRSGGLLRAGPPIVAEPAPLNDLLIKSNGVPLMRAEESMPANIEEVYQTEIPMNNQMKLDMPVQEEAIRMNQGVLAQQIPGFQGMKPSAIPPDYYFLDDGANGELSVQNNICSPSCCNSGVWPAPFPLKDDPYVCANKDKFTPTNMTCQNSWGNAGCMCLTKPQARNILNRGGNGVGLF